MKSIPLTEKEMELLKYCEDARGMKLYFILLWREVNFGRVFPERGTLKINLSNIARVMTKKCKGDGVRYTSNDIHCMLESLASAGLVEDIAREGKFLNFRLPHILMEAYP